jgi:TolB protein
MNPTAAPEAPATTRVMSEDDLLDFVWIADPQISPDGKSIAFTHVSVDREEDRYRTALWVIDCGKPAPRPLTSGTRDSQPRWSPDGRTIAFARVTDPEKPAQLWLLPMAGGEAAALTSLPKGASSPAWSPDGKQIAFLSYGNDVAPPEHPYYKHVTLRLMPVEGGTPRVIAYVYGGQGTINVPSWSPDGRMLAFVSNSDLN